MAAVRLDKVRKTFGSVTVLHDVDLSIRDDEFMVFVGPSGCGKSTLLRCIAGLEEISGGTIHIGERRVDDVPPAERGIAMVFQSYALYPHLNLYDNMAFSLQLNKVPKPEIDRLVQQAAKVLHIDHLLERKPKDLSGGQRQRVAIGRAIVRKPQVFLFDEPLSNLDAALRVRMRYEFAKLHEELKTTMVYVTHDQVEAMTLADRIVVLNAGRIEQVGAPLELYEHPRNVFVAGFIGSPKMNFVRATLEGRDAAGAIVRLADGGPRLRCAVDPGDAAPGASVTVGIRPEHLRPMRGAAGDGDNRVALKLSFVEPLGGTTFAYGDFAGMAEPMTCELDGHERLHAGDVLTLELPPERAHLFDAQGLAFKRLAAPSLARAA